VPLERRKKTDKGSGKEQIYGQCHSRYDSLATGAGHDQGITTGAGSEPETQLQKLKMGSKTARRPREEKKA